MKVVLLDRDGTVIKDPPDYRITSEQEIVLFDDSISALQILAEHGFKVIFITNQAGIAEGIITEQDFWRINNEVISQLSPSHVKILATYMNWEAGEDASEWRKPGPLMLQRAAQDYNFDLADVFMVGDNVSDIEAANRAGCKGGVLVKTATNKEVTSDSAVFSADTLTEAVNYIVENG